MSLLCSTELQRKRLYYSVEDVRHFVDDAAMLPLLEASSKLYIHDGATYVMDKTVRLMFPDLPYERKCVACNEVKPLDAAFPKASTEVHMRSRTCSTCTASQMRATNSQRIATETKLCIVCKIPKPKTSFNLSASTCYTCNDKKTAAKSLLKAEADPGSQFCRACRRAKPLDAFGPYASCTACREKTRARMAAKRQNA